MGVGSDGAKDTTSPGRLPSAEPHLESVWLCFTINPSHPLRQNSETSGFPAEFPGLPPEREEGNSGWQGILTTRHGQGQESLQQWMEEKQGTCYGWVWLCFLTIPMLKSRSPTSQNVTSFGNRAIADITSEGEVIKAGPGAIWPVGVLCESGHVHTGVKMDAGMGNARGCSKPPGDKPRDEMMRS